MHYRKRNRSWRKHSALVNKWYKRWDKVFCTIKANEAIAKTYEAKYSAAFKLWNHLYCNKAFPQGGLPKPAVVIPYLLPRELRLLARTPNSPVFLHEYHTEEVLGPFLLRETRAGFRLLPISTHAAWALLPVCKRLSAAARTEDNLRKHANAFCYGRPEQAAALATFMTTQLQEKKPIHPLAVRHYNELVA